MSASSSLPVVRVNKHARVGKPGKAPVEDESAEKVDIDLRKVAAMKLWDMSKTQIAAHFGISTARMNKIVYDNRGLLPWNDGSSSAVVPVLDIPVDDEEVTKKD